MRNPICKYCNERKVFCIISCKKYRKAQLTRAERRMRKRFGEDYKAEDRYVTKWGLIFSAVIIIIILVIYNEIAKIGARI